MKYMQYICTGRCNYKWKIRIYSFICDRARVLYRSPSASRFLSSQLSLTHFKSLTRNTRLDSYLRVTWYFERTEATPATTHQLEKFLCSQWSPHPTHFKSLTCNTSLNWFLRVTMVYEVTPANTHKLEIGMQIAFSLVYLYIGFK